MADESEVEEEGVRSRVSSAGIRVLMEAEDSLVSQSLWVTNVSPVTSEGRRKGSRRSEEDKC